MLKIVSFKICPFVQRVTAALAAKNIPFEIEYIDLKKQTSVVFRYLAKWSSADHGYREWCNLI